MTDSVRIMKNDDGTFGVFLEGRQAANLHEDTIVAALDVTAKYLCEDIEVWIESLADSSSGTALPPTTDAPTSVAAAFGDNPPQTPSAETAPAADDSGAGKVDEADSPVEGDTTEDDSAADTPARGRRR